MDVTRLAAAKLWLISPAPPGDHSQDSPRNLAYLAHALYALVQVPAPEVPRMTVDEHWRLYVNPAWLIESEISEIGRELLHLTWHLLAEHADRARSLDVDSTTVRFWKAASDAAVAATLDPDRPPEGLPTAVNLGLPPRLSAEQFYALLSKLPLAAAGDGGALEPTDGCGSGCDGIARVHELPPEVEPGVDEHHARELRRLVAIDYLEGTKHQPGTQPGDAWRWAQRVLHPTVAWEPLLTGVVRRAIGWAAGRGDYTYSRPSRRAGSVKGIILPGMRRPVPRVALVVDTSGSVDDGLLERALGEVDGVLRALGIPGGDVTVYSCDAAVQLVERVRRARDARLAGGGGTDLRLGLAAADAQRPRPDVVIVFTDGHTPWPPAPPTGCSVVVALLGRTRTELPPTPQWATRVECLLD